MQNYRWIGITLDGQICRGKTWARSRDHLINLLIDLGIGLIKVRVDLVRSKKIGYNKKITMINHLVSLLKSDIKINQALAIIKDSTSDVYLKIVLNDIKDLIECGERISIAFEFHKDIFDHFFCSLISAGEYTGNLLNSLEYFVSYSRNLISFRQKIKKLLIMPIITFFMFFSIIISLFVFIVPRFNDIFLSFDKPLPVSTYYILKISELLTTRYLLLMSLVILVFFLFSSLILRKSRISKVKDKIMFNIPGVNKLYKLIYRAIFLQMLNVLLKGNVSLINALGVISNSIGNDLVSNEVSNIADNLRLGHSFNISLSKSRILSNKEILEIVYIGESSGDVSNVIGYLSDYHANRIFNILNYLSNIVQPLILVILGLLIASVILALYVPIFTLSDVIS